MDLINQVQILIDEAPQDGRTPQAMKAIAPALLQIAQQFQNLSYYVLQSLDQNWQIVTLQNRKHPELEKTVIYAYGSLKEATQAGQDPSLMATAVPITHLLFQLIALPKIDSLIILEPSQGVTQSLEVHRTELETLINHQLEKGIANQEIQSSESLDIHLA